MSQRQLVLQNVSMSTSGHEYSVTIPPGAINVHIKLRDATNSMIVYTTSVGNTTPSVYYTVDPGTEYRMDTKMDGQIIYMQGSAASVVAEVGYFLDQ